MEEQDKAIARDLSKTDMSNMPDRALKVMIIKIFTGLKSGRQEWDPNTKIGIRAEIKDSINEMRNMPDGMSSRMEASGELISDLEYRVLETNQAEQKETKKNYAKQE